MSITKNRKVLEYVFGTAALILFLAAFNSIITTFQNEAKDTTDLVATLKPAEANYVEAVARILSVDLIKGDMLVRVVFIPKGSLANDGELNHEFALYVNSASGGQNRVFPKGKDMSPIDVTIDLGGTVTMYPFDSHSAGFELYLTEPVEGGSPLPVPLYTRLSGTIAGLDLNAALNPVTEANYSVIDISMARSPMVKGIVIFAMVLLWLITLTVLFMFLAVVFRGRKLEFSMFGFNAGFLFSFVAFRNAMPGVPPIGVFSDYLAFFWGYAVISLCLVGLTITWHLRPHN
jgi:hypothetical protein